MIKANEAKFYMNNPCKITRVINLDFVEIEVYPKFNDNICGAEWCTECMVGNQGTPQSHTCEAYQNVIDELNEVENRMIVIVEARLLQNNPIEFLKIKPLQDKIKKLDEKINTITLENTKLTNEYKSLEADLIRLNERLTKKREEIDSLDDEFEKKKNETKKQLQMIDDVSVDGIFKISTTELKSLIKTQIEMESLEAGGVDNWEWYGESLISEEDLELRVVEEMKSLLR